MNKSLILVAGMSILGLASLSAPAEAAPTSCSLWTLHGTLAWGGPPGVNANSGQPFANSGMESYDGKGNLKYYELQSDGYLKQKFVGTGTYTITSNCIATVIYDGDIANPYTYFVAPDGSAYYYNNNLGLGRVSGGRVDRISTALLIK